MAISGDGQFIVSGSEDKTIKIFSIKTKKEVYQFQQPHEGEKIYLIVLLTLSNV